MKMLDYVKLAQPRLRDNLERAEELVEPLLGLFCAANPSALRIVACGSSRHAALMARNALQQLLHIPVIIVTPEAFVAQEHELPKDALNLFVTQSGYSTNTLAAIDFACALGNEPIALTGNCSSPVAEHAAHVIDWGVGTESVDFVTMGVQTLVAFFFLLGIYAAKKRGSMSADAFDCAKRDLAQAVLAHARALEASETFCARHRLELAEHTPILVVGNGALFGVAAEACLKFNECLKRPASHHELEEFVHGPEMQLTPAHTLFLLESGATQERSAYLVRAFEQVSPKTYLMSFPSAGGQLVSPSHLELSACPSPYQALPALVPFQWMCASLMDELDCEDVHPFLALQEDALATKAEGYNEAIRALEQRALAQALCAG